MDFKLSQIWSLKSSPQFLTWSKLHKLWQACLKCVPRHYCVCLVLFLKKNPSNFTIKTDKDPIWPHFSHRTGSECLGLSLQVHWILSPELSFMLITQMGIDFWKVLCRATSISTQSNKGHFSNCLSSKILYLTEATANCHLLVLGANAYRVKVRPILVQFIH